MNTTIDKDVLDSFRDKILAKYNKKDHPLMQVLQEAQKEFGYIPIEVQEVIGKHLHISTARISGVVSFYSMFSDEPQGKHTIGVCMGTACYVKGGERLLERVSEKIGASLGETSQDGRHTLAPTRCVGACSLAPVIMVNDEIHSHVTSEDVHHIIGNLE